MITVRYLNKQVQQIQHCVIRPTPLVSISMNSQRTKESINGVSYTVTLTGTILSDEGTPYATEPGNDFVPIPEYPSTGSIGTTFGPYNGFDDTPLSARKRPPKQKVKKHAHAIMSKQRALRSLFLQDGQIVTITDVDDESAPLLWFYARLESITFEEGLYVNTSNYTITLQTDEIAHGYPTDDSITTETDYFFANSVNNANKPRESLVESFTENWSIEPEDNPENLFELKTYRITHNISAVGKTKYLLDGNLREPAWWNAKKWVIDKLSNSATEYWDRGDEVPPKSSNVGYPNVKNLTDGWYVPGLGYNLPPFNYAGFGADNLNLQWNADLYMEGAAKNGGFYRGWNHTANESIDKTAGSYSITESWILAKEPVLENFNSSVDISSDSPFTTIRVQGNITGLAAYMPEDYNTNFFDNPDARTPTDPNQKYVNALTLFNVVSNDVTFNGDSRAYLRAQNTMLSYSNKPLNPVPLSTSISYDEFNGVINYTVTYNDRPLNSVTGALKEDIQITDTAPGDIYSVIPVLGRQTGPILQYIGGRTEYKRDVSINLVMDRNSLAYIDNRQGLILQKPSVISPTNAQIANLVKQLSPANEPGVRKWFIQPPSESWNPKEGSYSLNLSFTYELDV